MAGSGVVMSIVFKDPDQVAHWVSHQKDDVNQIGGWTERRYTAYCGRARNITLTGAWVDGPREGVPTCFQCLRAQALFAAASRTLRDAGVNGEAVERLHKLQHGEGGKNLDDLIELHRMGMVSTKLLVKIVFDVDLP